MIIEYSSPEDLDEKTRREICRIIFNSFKQKFKGSMKRIREDRWPEILMNTITFSSGYYYSDNGSVKAAALLSTKEKPCFKLNKLAKKELGLIGSLIFDIQFIFPVKTHDTIKLEMIAVDTEARGTGIGTKLIRKMISKAATEGISKTILEVVDTNPRAIKLYESMGYQVKKKVRTAPITNALGFKAYFVMERPTEN